MIHATLALLIKLIATNAYQGDYALPCPEEWLLGNPGGRLGIQLLLSPDPGCYASLTLGTNACYTALRKSIHLCLYISIAPV